MPVKLMMTADVSTTHMSLSTRMDLNEGRDIGMTVVKSDGGFLFSTYEENVNKPKVPADLKLVLSYARHGGADYVLFDQDGEVIEELPQYDDGNIMINRGTLIEQSGAHCTVVSRHDYEDDHQGWVEEVDDPSLLTPYFGPSGATLPDGDYRAPDGLWLEIGGVDVRVYVSGSEGDEQINVGAYVHGHADKDDAVLMSYGFDKSYVADLAMNLSSEEMLRP